MDDLRMFLIDDIVDSCDTITCNVIKENLTLADLYRLDGFVKAAIVEAEQAVEADPKRCKICGKDFNYCPYCEKSGAA